MAALQHGRAKSAAPEQARTQGVDSDLATSYRDQAIRLSM